MHRLSVVSIALLAGAVCISAQVALRSYGDETYALKVGIGKDAKGNSNQEFYLSVDAFGSETRVAGVDCWQCCEKRRYDASLSNTNKNSCKAHSPDGADGTKTDDCTDSFQSAIANFPSLPFTEVTSSPIGSSFVASPSDGVAGLSGAVYGYYFTRTCSNDGANGGTINLNALDNANCGAASATVTLTQDANKVLSTALTQFKIDADTAVPSPTGTGQWLATFSTTSPYVVVPQTQFDAINAILKAPKDASGNYNTFDCGNLPAAAKPIKFSFTPVPATTTTPAIAQEVSIDIQQLVFRTDDNVCTLRVQPQPAGDATKQNYWDFGLPLFRSVCSLVNVNGATKTIQFAPTKVAANYACTYNKPAVLQACNAPQTTSTAETTISPNATQAPSQTTTPKGASRGQVMSLLSVFTLFALSALF